MTPQEKQQFYDSFMDHYLKVGFGAWPKREIDLFIFHFLTQSSAYRNQTNYQLANAFGLPESRIKTYRLNAALRFGDINPRAVLARIVERLIDSRQFAELHEGRIDISLEDPIEKRELENFLKSRGYHADYTLNSEVLRISPVRLLELIVEHAEHADEAFDRLIRDHIQDEAMAGRILANAPSLRQKMDRLRAENLNLDTLKTLIGTAFGMMTG